MPAQDLTSPRAKNLALLLLALTQFVVVIDASIVNVALPTLATEFKADTNTIEWVVTGYLLSLALWIPASGWLGDRFGTNANTVTLRRYTVADAYAAWTRGRYRVTARVDNLTDAVYASWADPFYLQQVDPSFLYANQLMLGAPRTFGVQVQVGF